MSIDFVDSNEVDPTRRHDYVKRSSYTGRTDDGTFYMTISSVIRNPASFEEIPVPNSKRTRKKYVAPYDYIEIEICDGTSVWEGEIAYSEHNVQRKRAGGRDDTWDSNTFIFNVIDAIQNSIDREKISFRYKFEESDMIFDVVENDNGVIKKYLNNCRLEIAEEENVQEFLATFRSLNFHSFVDAARVGNFDKVRSRPLQDIDVNSSDEIGWTPLQYAAFGGHLDVVMWLVDEQGANVNGFADSSWAPAQCAARKKHVEVVKFLVSREASLDNGVTISDTIPSIFVETKQIDSLRWVAGDAGPIDQETKARHGVRDTTPLVGMFQLP